MVYDEFKRTNIQSSDESNSDEVVQSEDDSLQWAKEAFAKLKQQQENKNVLQANFETNNNLNEEIFSLNNSHIADNSKM